MNQAKTTKVCPLLSRKVQDGSQDREAYEGPAGHVDTSLSESSSSRKHTKGSKWDRYCRIRHRVLEVDEVLGSRAGTAGSQNFGEVGTSGGKSSTVEATIKEDATDSADSTTGTDSSRERGATARTGSGGLRGMGRTASASDATEATSIIETSESDTTRVLGAVNVEAARAGSGGLRGAGRLAEAPDAAEATAIETAASDTRLPGTIEAEGA